MVLAVELEEEAFESLMLVQLVDELIDLALQSIDLKLQVLQLALDLLAPLGLGVGFLLHLRRLLLVIVDELPELLAVRVQVGLGGLQRFECALLFRLEVIDLLDNRFMCQLDQEHVLLLIDELVHVLRLSFPVELHAGFSNLGGGRDLASLLGVEVVGGLCVWHGDNIFIFYALQGHARRGGLLVPDLEMLLLFFGLLLPLLLSLPLDEDLLVVGWCERRNKIVHLSFPAGDWRCDGSEFIYSTFALLFHRFNYNLNSNF